MAVLIPIFLLLGLGCPATGSGTGTGTGTGTFTGLGLLGGVYPDFTAPVYTPTASVCDVTASPWSAKGDGTTDVTSGIQAAIDKCPRDPDGRFTVLLKEGSRFVTGSLNLTSGCRLVVDGALLGSTDPAMYL